MTDHKAFAGIAAVYLLSFTLPPKASSQALPPRFEVVSVKPCHPGGRPPGRSGGAGAFSPGTLRLSCVTVSDLIQSAYVDYAKGQQAINFVPVPIKGGPSRMNTDRYEIDAKAEGAPGYAMMKGPMLQAILEDRFKLKIHREEREVPVYALTVAKDGPKLQRSKEGSCVPLDYSLPTPYPQFCGQPKRGDRGLHLIGATMADLCAILSAPEISDRPIIDKTGIVGMFDIQLPGPGQFRGSGAVPTDPLADSFDAIRAAVETLGLKLERAKGAATDLVIDHLERPSEN